MLNERVVARWDFYVYTSIYASQVMITAKRNFFDVRVAMYEKLDGKDGRPDWRVLLKDKLKGYMERFPACTDSVFRRKKHFATSNAGGHGVRAASGDEQVQAISNADAALF